ncbi:DUF885 domain-containing protein [Corynebacterium sp. TAE3-ERU16]|nr:DUF885 domain-containing protein [Corynebacterium sp. TAE3-ERU16]
MGEPRTLRLTCPPRLHWVGMSSDTFRNPSRLDLACETFVHDLAALSPLSATEWGFTEYNGDMEDFSPEHHDAVAERTRRMLDEVDALEKAAAGDGDVDFDDVDRVTAAVLRDRLGLRLELHEAGEDIRQLDNIASPVQWIRDTFSLMPTDTTEARADIISRLGHVPRALDGHRASLMLAAEGGHVAARRQVEQVIAQCEDLAGDESSLNGIGIDADQAELVRAREAFGVMATWLRETLLPQAPAADGVGRERYERFSREFVGATVDLDEAYEWGLTRLAEIVAEQEAIAVECFGEGTTVGEAMDRFNADERYRLDGVDALKEWMQTTADQAIADLDGTAFTIPEPVRTIECCIDPAGTGGIFYTPPSSDFTRPGRMWWSVPRGETVFHTWQELTTVFHEGVPGHHLQIGQTLCESDRLNLWRRVACWNSGQGEGWALYAEQLMADLGHHTDPATRMGLLDGQRLRAARVVLDIGVHLGKTTPDGGTWDAEYAASFLRANSAMAGPNLDFELNRYLGWPGQAPSYALGQRLWQQLRDEALDRGMTLPQFHAEALALGSIPMGILRDCVLDGLDGGENR